MTTCDRMRTFKGEYIALSRRRLSRLSALPALCAAAIALTALTGCQGRKVVARVNNTPIMEDEYLQRIQYIRQLPQNSTMDAGGYMLVSLIQDTLTDELAKEKKWVPAEESVNQLAETFRRTRPDFEQQIAAKTLTE